MVAGASEIATFDVDIALREGGRVAYIDADVLVDRTRFGMTWNPLRAAAKTAKVTAHLVFRHTNEMERSW
jgi:hypothetical protein